MALLSDLNSHCNLHCDFHSQRILNVMKAYAADGEILSLSIKRACFTVVDFYCALIAQNLL
jgi:hypothetical protein